MSKSKEQQFKESRLRTRTNSIEAYDRGKRLLGYSSTAAIAFSSAYMGFLSGAQSGDSVSAGYLGLMYQAGHGVDTSSLEYNFTRAVIWYARAINLCKRRGDAAAMQEKAEYEAKLNEMLHGQTLEEFGIILAEDVDSYVDATQDILISTGDLPDFFDEDELAVMAQFLAPGALPGVGASPASHAAAAAVTAPAAPTPTVAPVAHHDAAPHLVPHPLDHGHTLGLAGADHGGDCG